MKIYDNKVISFIYGFWMEEYVSHESTWLTGMTELVKCWSCDINMSESITKQSFSTCIIILNTEDRAEMLSRWVNQQSSGTILLMDKLFLEKLPNRSSFQLLNCEVTSDILMIIIISRGPNQRQSGQNDV